MSEEAYWLHDCGGGTCIECDDAEGDSATDGRQVLAGTATVMSDSGEPPGLPTVDVSRVTTVRG